MGFSRSHRGIAWFAAFMLFTSVFPFFGVSFAENAKNTAGPPTDDTGAIVLPTGQVLYPAGELITWGDKSLENHALDLALSPDGRFIAVLGRFDMAILDAQTKEILDTRKFDTSKEGVGVYAGVVWDPNGSAVYVPVSGADSKLTKPKDGKVLKIPVNDGKFGEATVLATFPPEDGRPALPNGLTLSPDGSTLFVALNGTSAVAAVHLADGSVTRIDIPTSYYPYSVAAVGDKLYVTMWGGRKPQAGDPTGLGGWNDYNLKLQQKILVDPATDTAASGTVEVLRRNADGTYVAVKTLDVGLLPGAVLASGDGKYVYVANAGSDTVSVIQTDTDNVVETIWASVDGLPYGASPNALALSPDGSRLYVADGMLNAVAVIELGKKSGGTGTEEDSRVLGFLPTAQYPSGLAVTSDGETLWVADLEGVGPYATTNDPNDPAFQSPYPSPETGEKFPTAGSYNAHRQLSMVSAIPLPKTEEELTRYTETVWLSIQYNRAVESKKALESPRPDAKPRPLPERIGEPSTIKHVVYIIKENRTYDQVLGDMPEGNGDKNLVVFDEPVTPNQHTLAREFALLDNFYLPAKSSAEGHPWATTAYLSDYVEKNMRAWFRGYPHTLLDALAPPKTGYIWDNVLEHEKTFRVYGEATLPRMDDNTLGWKGLFDLYLAGKRPQGLHVVGTIPAVLQHTHPEFPGEDYRFSDQLRAEMFLEDLRKFEASGEMPNFILIALPNDHTSGTKPGFPTPQSMVADNDLALGRIMEALSRSRFWPETAVFVVEDDAQDGWDHVSPFRSPAFVLSPYSRLGKTVGTFYTQIDVIRTMEQILGIPPMNLMDLAAKPMDKLFTDSVDLRPYLHRPNRVPLDRMNLTVEEAAQVSELHKHYAELGERMAAEIDNPDNDELLNRMIWFSVKGDKPYPERPNYSY